ncbi:MAG: uroporphyrinogen-III synthase [Betaproteobacteria bacterium]|nr:uroporphyrinogen-III synthase [Betaproteobacteria bacterium]
MHRLESQSPAAGPLSGVGIVITRPARQAAGLAQQVAALGATPIVFPVIVILPPADRAALMRVHAQIGHYDIAIFISANAVEYGAPDPKQWPARLATFAPGTGTAAALASAGIHDVRIPNTTFDSEGLLALPELNDVAGKRVAIFRGAGGRELLRQTLEQRGATVDYVECYRRRAPQTGTDGLLEAVRQRRAHALTLTSNEGLANLWSLLDDGERTSLVRLPAFVPHARVAAHARSLGFVVVDCGDSDAGLISGLLEWFALHPH